MLCFMPVKLKGGIPQKWRKNILKYLETIKVWFKTRAICHLK